MKDNLPRLLTLDETAAHLHVSRRWLQAFLRDRPYGRIAGRKRLFTEHDIAERTAHHDAERDGNMRAEDVHQACARSRSVRPWIAGKSRAEDRPIP